MLKEEKIFLKVAWFMLLLLTFTLYLGQLKFMDSLFALMGVDNPMVYGFIFNIIRIEGWMYPPQQTLIPAILGLGLSFISLLGLILMRKITHKRCFLNGLLFLILGFIEVLFMDISILGWMSGSLFIIGGFFLIQKSRILY